MLVSTNISFMVFSLPYSILNNEKFKQNNDVSIIANMLSYSNNSFNFIFYYLFSTGYRVRLKEIFESIFRSKSNRSQCFKCQLNDRFSQHRHICRENSNPNRSQKSRFQSNTLETSLNQSNLYSREPSRHHSNFHQSSVKRNQSFFNLHNSCRLNSNIHQIEIINMNNI